METSKKESSLRQTERAIDHLFNGDFDCAITLAAAAEGLLPITNDPHLFKQLRDHPESNGLDFNIVTNWLKHSSGPETVTISEFDALIAIARAITKFIAVYHQCTNAFEHVLRYGHQKGHLPKMHRDNSN